jgi:hypothetical protein
LIIAVDRDPSWAHYAATEREGKIMVRRVVSPGVLPTGDRGEDEIGGAAARLPAKE